MGHCVYGSSYPMVNEFSYQGYVTKKDLSNIHKAFERGHIKVWNAFANEWFTQSQQEEWEMSNCSDCDCNHHRTKSEKEYFNGMIDRYWDKFRKFTERTNIKWYNSNNIKALCKDKGLYFSINNPFTWSQPYKFHEEWVKEMKKNVWIDEYIRDCYYTMLNPNYPKFMYKILEMYLAESGESPNIYDKEETSSFRHDCPSTWLSSHMNDSWRFLIDIFGDINDNDEKTQMLRHFIMFLLKEGMFHDVWFRLNRLDWRDKEATLNGDPDYYLEEIIGRSRCFDPFGENVVEAEKKLLNLDKKWKIFLKKFGKLEVNKIIIS